MKEEQLRARDAEQLLANPVFKGAIAALNASLDRQMMGMDVVNPAICAKAIQAKQLLAGIEREIHRFIDTGEINDLINIEEARKTLRERVFKR